MAELFDVSELVRVAIEDERTGGAFYAAAAERVKDRGLKQTLSEMADQERFHQARFEKMLKDLGDVAPPEGYSGEYASYLTTLTKDRAFPDEAAARQMAEACENDRAFLDVALDFERNTLNLINEMRQLMSGKAKAIIDDVTCEEQAHVVSLLEAKDKLKA